MQIFSLAIFPVGNRYECFGKSFLEKFLSAVSTFRLGGIRRMMFSANESVKSAVAVAGLVIVKNRTDLILLEKDFHIFEILRHLLKHPLTRKEAFVSLWLSQKL
jgi:hypothetical protein